MVEQVLDWVEDTRMTQKVMVLLLFAGLTSIVLFQFIVEPQRQRAQAFDQTLRALDHQLATTKQDRQVESLQEEIAALTHEVEAEKRALVMSMDHVLASVLDKAQSVDVVITSWKSDEPVPLPETDLNRVTLRLHAEGGYHALAHLLEELQTFQNALTFKSVDFHAREQSEVNPERPIRASLELTGFQSTAVDQREQMVAVKGRG